MQNIKVTENFIPNYIIEEIEEYTKLTKQGFSKCMKWQNIKALLRLLVRNNRITKEEENIIKERYCLEDVKD